MKITIYELLGLVKDGKAPKKIICDDISLEYDENKEDYYGYYDGDGFFEYLFGRNVNFLNDKVRIIEDPKKIEKITIRDKTLGFPNGEWTARNIDKAFAIKINELIDEINKLKDSDK